MEDLFFFALPIQIQAGNICCEFKRPIRDCHHPRGFYTLTYFILILENQFRTVNDGTIIILPSSILVLSIVVVVYNFLHRHCYCLSSSPASLFIRIPPMPRNVLSLSLIPTSRWVCNVTITHPHHHFILLTDISYFILILILISYFILTFHTSSISY